MVRAYPDCSAGAPVYRPASRCGTPSREEISIEILELARHAVQLEVIENPLPRGGSETKALGAIHEQQIADRIGERLRLPWRHNTARVTDDVCRVAHIGRHAWDPHGHRFPES